MRLNPGTDGRLAVCAAAATMLTALALTPLVASAQWWLGALLVVLLVMVTGVVLRQVSGSALLAPVGQLLILAAVLGVVFTRGELLDPPAAVRAMADLVRAGLQVSREQAAPVDADPGIVFMLVGGTGVIGLLVDVLAASLRQTALAGLPLLALYCVPAALLPGGLHWYLFGVAATGFLLLLGADADERVLSWGRILGPGTRGGGSPDASRSLPSGGTWLGAGGRRAAGVAVLAALVLPSLAPGLDGRVFGSGGDGSGRGGSGAITRINPILTLRQDLNETDDTELLRYRTTMPDPEPLRIVTADDFTGKVWQPGTPQIPRTNQVQNGLPDPPGLSPSVAVDDETTRIDIGPLRQTYLPLPYPTQSIDITGTWLYDPDTLNVIGDHVTTRGISYTARHLAVRPTAQQLAASTAGISDVSSGYLALPTDLPASIRDAAIDVGGTGSAYDQAVRLQRWFRTSFTYSTKAPKVAGDDSGMASIAQFLVDKRGYCVHFASAMAVMARVLRIPSRVAIGFLPGERQANGEMVVTAHDAHAWPELYFTGVGWVRFEPTPRGAGTTPPAWTQPLSPVSPGTSASTSVAPSDSASTGPSASATRAPRREDLDSTSTAGAGRHVPWRLLEVLLVLLLVLALPRAAASAGRAARWRAAARAGPTGPPAPPGPGGRAAEPDASRALSEAANASRALAEAAWEDLRGALGDLGVSWARSWTPRATRQRMLAEYDLPEGATQALDRLVQDLEEARYAPPPAAGEPAGRGAAARREDVRAVTAAVAWTRSRPVRLRAALFPASGIETLARWLEAANGGVARATARTISWLGAPLRRLRRGSPGSSERQRVAGGGTGSGIRAGESAVREREPTRR